MTPTATRVRPRQARGVVTRRKVLAAAEERFSRQGYDSTSMAEVAAKAGVGVGTLYHHFPDKRALLFALMEDWGARELDQKRAREDFEDYLGPHARAAFRRNLDAEYDELERRGSFYRVLLELSTRDLEITARINEMQARSIEQLQALLELGQERGVMRKEADMKSAAFLIRHALDMVATHVLERRTDHPPREQLLDALTDMIARYVLEDPR